MYIYHARSTRENGVSTGRRSRQVHMSSVRYNVSSGNSRRTRRKPYPFRAPRPCPNRTQKNNVGPRLPPSRDEKRNTKRPSYADVLAHTKSTCVRRTASAPSIPVVITPEQRVRRWAEAYATRARIKQCLCVLCAYETLRSPRCFFRAGRWRQAFYWYCYCGVPTRKPINRTGDDDSFVSVRLGMRVRVREYGRGVRRSKPFFGVFPVTFRRVRTHARIPFSFLRDTVLDFRPSVTCTPARTCHRFVMTCRWTIRKSRLTVNKTPSIGNYVFKRFLSKKHLRLETDVKIGLERKKLASQMGLCFFQKNKKNVISFWRSPGTFLPVVTQMSKG